MISHHTQRMKTYDIIEVQDRSRDGLSIKSRLLEHDQIIFEYTELLPDSVH